MNDLISKRFSDHVSVVQDTLEHLSGGIVAAAELIIESYRSGGGVFLFGNGGSAADAQHIAGELVGRFLLDRPPMKAWALSTDTSILTCLANDYSYEVIFVRQLQASARSGDVAVGLSTSGNSPNVVDALKYARENSLRTIALTGAGGGKCAEYTDVLLDIPAKGSPAVQNAGVVVYHILCELVEQAWTQSA